MLIGAIAALCTWMLQLLWMITQVVAAIVLAIVDFLLAVLLMVLRFLREVLRIAFDLLRKLVPWLLKAAAMALYVFGLWYSFERTLVFYGAFTVDLVQAGCVAVAVVLVEVFVPVIVLRGQPKTNRKVFQTLAAVGLLGIAFAVLLGLAPQDPNTYLVAGVLPYFGVGVLTIYEAIQLKSRRAASRSL